MTAVAAPVVAAGITKATVSTAAAVASAAVGALSAIQQGRQQKQQSEFQAAVERQRAERERLIAASNEDDFRRQQSRLQASRRAALGGSGVESSTGSPLLVSEDFASEIELQALRIRNGGEVNATRAEQNAQLLQVQGRNAQTGGFFRAGGSLLRGAEKVFGK
jgi:hypothetical protein